MFTIREDSIKFLIKLHKSRKLLQKSGAGWLPCRIMDILKTDLSVQFAELG